MGLFCEDIGRFFKPTSGNTGGRPRGESAVVLAVVLNVLLCNHLTEVTAFRNFALVCSTVFSVTNRASFGARTFVIDETSSEKQARRGVQIYKVL